MEKNKKALKQHNKDELAAWTQKNDIIKAANRKKRKEEADIKAAAKRQDTRSREVRKCSRTT